MSVLVGPEAPPFPPAAPCGRRRRPPAAPVAPARLFGPRRDRARGPVGRLRAARRAVRSERAVLRRAVAGRLAAAAVGHLLARHRPSRPRSPVALLYGARNSLVIGIVANGAALVIGTLVGVVAGYYRGLVGTVLMRFTDLMMAFPALLLAICLAAVLRPSLWIVALVIALVNWVQVARRLLGDALPVGARVHPGRDDARASSPRILFRHVLPHLTSTVIVYGTLGISTTVLLEATLSFLGVGVQPPTLRGATSSSRTRPTSRRRPGWSSSPARRSSSWRSPSTSSATPFATRSIRPKRAAADGDLSRAAPVPGRPDPPRGQPRDLRAPLSPAGGPRPADRGRHPPRPRRSRASGRSSGSTSPSSSSTRAISATSSRAISAAPTCKRRKSPTSSGARLPASLPPDAGGDPVRAGARADDGPARRRPRGARATMR